MTHDATSPVKSGCATDMDAQIEDFRVAAYRIPTDAPESDGTLSWAATTLVVVEIEAGGHTGLGYTFAHHGVAALIEDPLRDLVIGRRVDAIDDTWHAMFARLRNQGRGGATAMAVSAVDVALWDLKARLLHVPLVQLLGPVRETLPVYGSGGFTSYSDGQLTGQFQGWAAEGITRFKMKVGREPGRDRSRARVARRAIGDAAELMVDANSAYSPREAAVWAEWFVEEVNACWLEEPLDPEDLAGLRQLRTRMPASLEIAEGEYGYGLDYFRRLLEAEAADVAMPDATRCGGITGFLKVAHLCEAWSRPMSTHCAPSLHLPVACAVGPVRHAEYFHDHARIESLLFEGAARPEGGVLRPDTSRPGHGLEFKWSDAERFVI